MKKLFLIIGVLVVVFFALVIASVAAAIYGHAKTCQTAAGKLRSEQEITRLLNTSGLTLTDAEATALGQKYLGDKIKDPKICFSPGLMHLSGSVKVGSLNPSFYVSTGLDLSGETPRTKNIDIRIGAIPNLFIFSPIESMIENIINDDLSQAKTQEKYSVEFQNGSATVKRLK